ncbi:hypothetical protein GC163_19960 [bacterium]|nr:hypothetical protein [bacterium]
MIPSRETERLRKLRPVQPGEEGYVQSCVERLDGWVRRLNAERLGDLVAKRRRETSKRDVGGPPGITAPPTLHQGGLDWLDLSVYGETSERYNDVCLKASLVRDQVRRDKDKWGLFPIGTRFGRIKGQGEGTGYSHCPYVFEYKSIKFKFGSPRSDGKPLVFVDIPGESFLVLGERSVLLIVGDVLKLMGITIEKIRVRRVDACIDMPGVSVEQFWQEMTQKHFTTRSKKVRPFLNNHMELTGFTVQGECCSMTVYDKLADIREKQKEHQLSYLQEHRWNGEQPAEATRVEFRIRPGSTVFADIRDLFDLLEGLGSIFAWATGAWFRMVKVHDRRHTERAKVVPLWRDVVASFQALAGKFDCFVHRRFPGMCDATKLTAVALGVLAKAFALTHVDPAGEPLETLIASVMTRQREPDKESIALVRADLMQRYEIAEVGTA